MNIIGWICYCFIIFLLVNIVYIWGRRKGYDEGYDKGFDMAYKIYGDEED